MNPRIAQRKAEILGTPVVVHPSEHQEQAAIVQWWAYECKSHGIPERLLFAIPNGGERHPAVARKLKTEGVRPGTPDLMLAVARAGRNGLFIEMKAMKRYPKAEQREFHAELRSQGYRVTVCRGADAAMAEIREYLRERAVP